MLKKLLNIDNPITAYEFVEKAEFEKGFKEFYNKDLKSRFISAEEIRRTYLLGLARRAIVLMIIAIAANAFGANFSLIIFAILGVFLIILPYLKYQQVIKDLLLPNIAHIIGNFSYNSNSDFEKEDFISSRLFKDNSFIRTSDEISGMHHGIKISSSFSKLKYKNQKQFFAMIITYTLEFDVQGLHLFFGQDSILDSQPNIKGNIYQINFKYFKITSSDERKARLLFKPEMLKILYLLSKVANKEINICGSYFSDKLAIIIPVKENIFAFPNILKPIDLENLHLFLAFMHYTMRIAALLSFDHQQRFGKES